MGVVFHIVCFTALVLHGAHSYILLTANVDDLHSILKEIVDSPVTDQIGGILRRAYNQFGHDRVQDFIKRSGILRYMRSFDNVDGPGTLEQKAVETDEQNHEEWRMLLRELTQEMKDYKKIAEERNRIMELQL